MKGLGLVDAQPFREALGGVAGHAGRAVGGAVKLLPQYEADEGPLTSAQLQQIKQRAPQGKKKSLRSSLFEVEPA